MAEITKYVLLVPKDISVVDGVYKMTLPTAAVGFIAVELSHRYDLTDAYADGVDNRQVWVLKGEEATINNWITANSDMVTEKIFAEADTIGQDLEPAHIITDGIHTVTTENGVITSDVYTDKNVPVFDLQTRLDELGF